MTTIFATYPAERPEAWGAHLPGRPAPRRATARVRVLGPSGLAVLLGVVALAAHLVRSPDDAPWWAVAALFATAGMPTRFDHPAVRWAAWPALALPLTFALLATSPWVHLAARAVTAPLTATRTRPGREHEGALLAAVGVAVLSSTVSVAVWRFTALVVPADGLLGLGRDELACVVASLCALAVHHCLDAEPPAVRRHGPAVWGGLGAGALAALAAAQLVPGPVAAQAWVPVTAVALACCFGASAMALRTVRITTTRRIWALSADLAGTDDPAGVAAALARHGADLLGTTGAHVLVVDRRSGQGVWWHAGPDRRAPSTSRARTDLIARVAPPDDGDPQVLAALEGDLRPRDAGPAAAALADTGLPRARGVLLGQGDHHAAALLLPVGASLDPGLLHIVASHGEQALRRAFAVTRLRFERTHDRLTGLADRDVFRRRAEAAAAASALDDGPAAVLLLDVDGFKTVNDSLGHANGDLVLAEVARRLEVAVPGDVLVGRLGGDEFAVLCRDVSGEEAVVVLARHVLDVLQAPMDVGGAQVRLAGSVGVALAPRDGVTADLLLRHADVALDAAKTESVPVRVYDPTLTDTLQAPLSLAADLRLALSRGDITIVVQPLVRLCDGTVHSAEALARWRHPELGDVNPEAFVQAAERGGLVGELTGVVLDQALRACRGWLDVGLRVQVAVNLSARTLGDEDLPTAVARALAEHAVPGDLLCLELTETGVIASPDRALEILDRLRDLGVHVAVDDFGTGYSSMTYMSWLAPDQLKIDKSFVQRLRHDRRHEAIVRSINDLGKNLGVEVVAEGVGDLPTLAALIGMGCSVGQGYLFAEPLRPHLLPQWWLDHEAEIRDDVATARALRQPGPVPARAALPGRDATGEIPRLHVVG